MAAVSSNDSLPADQHTVLLVEDEVDLLDLYRVWLADTYTVRTASTGGEALDCVDPDIDVVLLDRRLPDMTGDDVLTEIRARGLDCRVAMVTAIAPDVDVLELGFDDYLTKPVTQNALVQVVETLLDRRQYDIRLQQYYRLLTKQTLLEAELDERDLRNESEYAALVDEIASIRADLTDRIEDFTDADFEAQFWALRDTTGRRTADSN